MKTGLNRQQSKPLAVSRSRRRQAVAALTSMPAGKCVPLAAIPMLREDALRGNLRVAVEMLETKELLMNPVFLRVSAYVVPFLALERFEGSRDQFDRSYMGEPQVEGGDVIPFIETHALGAHGSKPVYKYLGLHGGATDEVNTAYLEAYNLIWNYRAKNRSPGITPRTRLATDLAPAFWLASRFQHVVPDFDQAVIDGEIALNLVSGELQVKGPGGGAVAPLSPDGAFRLKSTAGGSGFGESLGMTSGSTAVVWKPAGTASAGGPHDTTYVKGLQVDLSDVYAEMVDGGVSVSLSNLALAKKTQAFAKLRERYQGHDEDWIIDMLMDGLSIPDQALKNPVLIADQTVRFAQAKRYATDAGNLAESAVSGAAMVDLRLRVPRLDVGGVVIVIAEAMPDQLFERQRDPFFHSTSVEAWPEYLRDTLDPEKVDVVINGEIDTDHATPNATFGYAPMNWRWDSWGPRIGGKFHRPSVDTLTDEERQRIWAVESEDPVLGEDFYLVSAIHTKPFLDTEADPFEATAVGLAVLDGNTVFGGMLVEATSNYDDVLAKAPLERIEKE